MKKNWKRAVVLALAAVLVVVSVAGCGKGGSTSDSTEGFVVSYSDPSAKDEAIKQVTLDRWAALSDVPVTWNKLNGGDTNEQLMLMFASGEYPEVIMGNLLKTTDVSKYAANGILLKLDEYINEEDTPNIYKLFSDYPKLKAANTLPDGHIYSLPGYNEFAPLYLESVQFINKNWLDQLGLEVPTTIDELLTCLRAFKTKDLNGNGELDEIPMTFYNGHGDAYPEALLSSWGVSTKHGTYDSYNTIRDGKVVFSPMMDEWKELIKFYNTCYEEGLLDMECFTHSYMTHKSKLTADISKVGFVWSTSNPFTNSDEYVAVPPLKVDGYTPLWHIHPGYETGSHDLFSITTACKNPKAAMKWIDKFFAIDESAQNTFGNFGTVIDKEDDGKITFNEVPEGKTLAGWINDNMIVSVPGAITADKIGTVLEKNSVWTEREENYKLYEEYMDTEVWPRPYYSVDEANRIAELTTDIFSLVDEKKAKWITGELDVEKEWEAYKESLKKMGIEELTEINQTAYDRYLKAIKEAE